MTTRQISAQGRKTIDAAVKAGTLMATAISLMADVEQLSKMLCPTNEDCPCYRHGHAQGVIDNR